MKKLMTTLAVMLIAVLAFSQSKNVFWSLTAKPKMDKKLEYEKKALTFIKAHFPNLKYRCWQVITGENSGSYVFVIGPTTWKEADTPMVSPKGEALQKTDGQALDALCESATSSYFLRQEDISNIKADRKLKYLSITMYDFEIGKWNDLHDYLMKVKETRAKSGSKTDVDILRPSMSGNGSAVGVARFMENLDELDVTENLGEAYDKINGDNSYYKTQQNIFSILKSGKTELRVLRPDLSQM